MSLNANTDTALDPQVIARENAAARNLFGHDNTNPDLGTAPIIPDAPAGNEAETDAPKPLSIRDQIAERAKAARAAEREVYSEEDLTTNDMGEFVPPFVNKQAKDDAAAAMDEARKSTEEEEERKNRSYTLKVRGNDIPVASRAELLKLAEVEADEADDYSDAQLIKFAQKQVAASQLLEEAKLQNKSARMSARADDQHTTDDPADETDPNEGQQPDPAEHQGKKADWQREAIEKIQFGDPEEAAEAFAKALERGVNEVFTKREITGRVQTVESMIERATYDFEDANKDLIEDPDLADLVYNRALVAEFKKDLVAGGVAPERADAVLGNNVAQAMQAYIAVAADGRVKIRQPHLMLQSAADAVRTKINRPAPNRERETPTPPAHDRLAAKRNLAPQPSRASVPQQTAAQRSGQTPEARSSVVAKMRQARGQG